MMHVYSDAYINKCKELGILTDEPIRKFPLRSANLAIVLKAYAITAHLPYGIDNRSFHILDDYKLYLTDDGLEWLIQTFKQFSFPYLRSTFQFVFSGATKDDIDNVNYFGYGNFRGITGEKPKAGTKQKAILVRSYGKNGKIKKEFPFDTIREARQAVLELTRFYPMEQFKLFRIRTQKKNGKEYTFRSEIPLILEKSKRGLNSTFGRVD